MTSTLEHRSEAEMWLSMATDAYQKARRTEHDWERDAFLVDAELAARLAQVHATLAVSK